MTRHLSGMERRSGRVQVKDRQVPNPIPAAGYTAMPGTAAMLKSTAGISGTEGVDRCPRDVISACRVLAFARRSFASSLVQQFSAGEKAGASPPPRLGPAARTVLGHD